MHIVKIILSIIFIIDCIGSSSYAGRQAAGTWCAGAARLTGGRTRDVPWRADLWGNHYGKSSIKYAWLIGSRTRKLHECVKVVNCIGQYTGNICL